MEAVLFTGFDKDNTLSVEGMRLSIPGMIYENVLVQESSISARRLHTV